MFYDFQMNGMCTHNNNGMIIVSYNQCKNNYPNAFPFNTYEVDQHNDLD